MVSAIANLDGSELQMGEDIQGSGEGKKMVIISVFN
jgi:hypothetical protein